MIKVLRERYNLDFRPAAYEAFLKDLDRPHPGAMEFRVAETPVFVPRPFLTRMEETCDYVLDLIADPSFMARTQDAIPVDEWVPGEPTRPPFICFDFGVCVGPDGTYEPKLIELQAFPTLFAFQVLLPEAYRANFPTIPSDMNFLLGGLDREGYLALLRRIIVADAPVEEVILLEVKPHEQKTRVDFYATEDFLGVRPVCLTELFSEGSRLYYMRDGIKTRVRRIYNRVIFDDLRAQRDSLGPIIDLTRPWEVEWVSHPNWFYRVSKYLLPFLHHPGVPEAYFVNELKEPPADLSSYVLKPLFSFAGQGVVIDVRPSDLEGLTHPEHWILQKKVPYADCIVTPDGTAKCEIRLMYFWEEKAARAIPTNNLARLSKGKMIGTRYNKDKTWVGGSSCFFEPPA